MNFQLKTCYILCILCTTSFIFANDGDDSTLKELKKKAKKEFILEHYHNAADLLAVVVEQAPNDAWAHYELGISYLHTSSFEEALIHIQEAYKIDPEHGVDKTYHYWLGKAYHQNQQFDEAIKEYDLYEETLRAHDSEREELELFKAQALIAKKEYNAPKNVVVLNMGDSLNTPFDEHSPVIADEGQTLYFTSKKKFEGHEKQDNIGEYYETIFVTKRDEKGVWSNPKVVPRRADENDAHDATIQIFDNNQKMLMYSDAGHGNIYIAEKDSLGNWGKSDGLDMINSSKIEDDATISQDGNFIIFSRESTGLRYDMNLYYTEKDKDGNWSEPLEFGSNINTDHEEESPYLTPDGQTLYFASNGPKSMGGYDIFKVNKTANGSWSDPINLGYPINSVYHDLYYQENSTRTMAFFASHREGGKGELDIYAMYPVQTVKVKGKIDQSIIEGKDSVHVYLNSKGEDELPFSTNVDVNEDGTFEQDVVSSNTYDVIITSGSQVLKKDNLTIEKTLEKGKTVEYNLKEKKEALAETKKEATKKQPNDGVDMALNADQIIAYLEKGFGVSLVLFDYDKSALRTDSKAILDRLFKELEEKPAIKVLLLGHTDDIGSENYNQKLSQERAKTAAKYLIQKGINKSRIDTKGMGETAPLVPNDTKEGRARNRRIEMQFTAQ